MKLSKPIISAGRIMKNSFEIEGKVLASWIAVKGALILKVAVTHAHRVGGENITVESVFRVIFNDMEQIPSTHVMAGDRVHVTGHLYLNHTVSASGCTHETLQLYADEIEVTG